MKVYRIRPDVNRYQYFLVEREEDVETLWMDCTSKAAQWVPPPVYVYEPKHKVGDFYNFGIAGLITSPRATDALRPHLEAAGELLPLPYQGEEFTVLNVLQCIDCLDQERSEERPGYYTKYVFHPDKLAQVPSTLFKIPQTHRGEILVVEGLRAPHEEFRYAVERAGLKGLLFTERWSDES